MTHVVSKLSLALLVGFVAGMAPAVASAAATTTSAATKYPYVYVNNDGSKTTIPAKPTRVVVYGAPEIVLDTLASFGVKPVAEQDDTYPDYVAGASTTGLPYWVNGGELNGVHVITGGSAGPNYEEIAAYHPDLIITSHTNYDADLDAIAPTISGYDLAGGSENVNPGAKNFYADNNWTSLAPVFNATARVNAILARLHDRTDALSGFVRGVSVDLPEFPAGQNFYLAVSDESLGGIFDSAGAKIQSIKGPSTFAGGEFELVSYELLDKLTATKVIATPTPPSMQVSQIEALPLFNQIPAVKSHQFYFSTWGYSGPIGTADAITDIQKQVFGVTGLEAPLVGPGNGRANPDDVADVDLGPTGKRVCWKLVATGTSGHPGSAVVQSASGKTLFSLGKGYQPTGCVNVSKSAGRQLLASTNDVVSVISPSSKVLLEGPIAPQGPAFFGNGKDKQYNLTGTSGAGNTGTTS
jgi:ABC-type Fe3+-hydroxamate transport system substrate-binding protein